MEGLCGSELRIVEAYRSGSTLVLTGGQADRRVRGEVLARLLVDDPEVVDVGPRARLDLHGALIEGAVDLRGASITRHVTMRDCTFSHPVVLSDADTRTLCLPGCHLPSLEATNVRAQGGVVLADGFATTGRLDLTGARIDGDLQLEGAHIGTARQLLGTESPALAANRMTVGGALMADRLRVDGQLRLISARVCGLFSLKDAVVLNPGSIALQGERMEVGESIFLARSRFDGRVHLLYARIDGGLDGTETVFGPDVDGRAGVYLTGIRVARNVALRRATIPGRVTLTRATVGSHVNMADAFFAKGSSLVLSRMDASVVNLRTAIPPPFTDLRHTRVDIIEDAKATWSSRIKLDGLEYRLLVAKPPCSVEDRLEWLDRNNQRYQPQPYDQLMTSLRANGLEQDARRVGLTRERARRRTLSRPGKVIGAVQDLTVAYGYRTWQAALWMVGLTAAAACVFAARRPQADAGAPAFNAVAFAFDLLLPVIDLGQASTHTPVGGSRWVAWAMVIAGWVLTSAVVAGLSRSFNRS